MKKFNIGLWIFLLLAICLSCFGLLNETIPGGHDLIFHLSRIEAISKGLQFGEFPVRIYPDYFYGYGYANGIMYPDLFLYPFSNNKIKRSPLGAPFDLYFFKFGTAYN